MGVTIKQTSRPIGADLSTATRRAMKAAGEVVLAASNARAPTEPEPRHGVHMTETGFVQVVPTVDGDEVQIGYTAYWAAWQHEHMDWHHPHGGGPKFLEMAAITGADQFWESVAAEARKAIES